MRSSQSKDLVDRQRRIEGWDQGRIENAKVLVGGAGALGNEVAKNLALLNFRAIRIVDRDIVELSNLNRCVHFEKSDIGKPKATALADRLGQTRLGISADAVIADLSLVALSKTEQESIYEGINLVFGCFDNAAARRQVNYDCWLRNIPLVDGGIFAFDGTVQTVVPPNPPCLECALRGTEFGGACGGEHIPGVGPVMPAVSVAASVVAGFMVSEALKILMKEEGGWNSNIGAPLQGKRLLIDLVHNSMMIIEAARDMSCTVCFHSNSI